ncbi:hypothetical protein GCM10025876_27930 [Demequina litorisediminis]|uniref:Secreted protein n=1 Tax=Demequina litorisediminis TaxID=1849022 RepID=A0ABQ6IFR9_9MICO|nr:hypothetical protein GCM10025876_27930 [Demequina litorisediminis]
MVPPVAMTVTSAAWLMCLLLCRRLPTDKDKPRPHRSRDREQRSQAWNAPTTATRVTATTATSSAPMLRRAMRRSLPCAAVKPLVSSDSTVVRTDFAVLRKIG